MSLDKELDKGIDKLGDAIEKKVENLISPGSEKSYLNKVGLGIKDVFRKKRWRSKKLLMGSLFWVGALIFIGISERQYLASMITGESILDNIIQWVYFGQKFTKYPLATMIGVIVILNYFKGYGEQVIELKEKFILAFERCGLYTKGKQREYPFMIRDGGGDVNGRFFIFKSPGIPLESWISAKPALESSLGENISTITLYKKNPGVIELRMGGADLPEVVEFNESYMNHGNETSIVVGIAREGAITHNFMAIPHLLIGGATGAGKTVVARALFYQCIKRLNALPFLIDFKGGADYTDFEDLGIEIISERKKVWELFERLIKEHKARTAHFRKNRVKNIDEYNQKFPSKKIRRVAVLIDELAELTDVKNVPRAEADYVDMIIGQLESMARLTRSTGIHLLLSTQRPDANVVPGQIKNNVPGRLCGYFVDDIAYRIVLDYIPYPKPPNPKEQKGRFIYSLGSENYYIQAPYFQEHHVDQSFKLDYTNGVLTMNTIDEDNFANSPIPSQQLQRARHTKVDNDNY